MSFTDQTDTSETPAFLAAVAERNTKPPWNTLIPNSSQVRGSVEHTHPQQLSDEGLPGTHSSPTAFW